MIQVSVVSLKILKQGAICWQALVKQMKQSTVLTMLTVLKMSILTATLSLRFCPRDEQTKLLRDVA